ncbi:MAG: DegT/DnrJ/EryC1/StrS family aminotransferase [Arenimonas sp.]
MQLPVVPINSLQRHFEPVSAELSQTAAQVIATGHYVLGPSVAAFEAEFAAYCGVAECIGVGNGTDALELALKAVGVCAGDHVAVCANAAMYGTSAVLACSAEPVFIDIASGGSAMDPAALAAAIATGPGLRAVILTHLYGRLAEVEAIAAMCRRHGIALVEDCAQAHGARLADGRRAGAIGDVASFSFYPTKNLGALGDAGAITSTDAAIGLRARQLRQYGWARKYDNALPGGRNSRLDELQAAMLRVLLPRLDAWNARRGEVARRYAAEIRNDAIELPPAAGEGDVSHLYVLRSDRRDALQAHLQSRGVQTDVHYPLPDHRQPCHGGRYAGVSLPNTERDATRVLSLPCFPELEAAEVQRVVDACNGF